MSGEMTGLVERLVAPTVVTDKGLVPCVDALVSCEITGCGKRFVAPVKVTGKGPVSCVGALVF
ncbi:hypothetical protein, partial [Sansalvadorimonas verongulae]|uniref:hypothetical protein n=1 Tax=Sansalvadorimonas verongulae TaxID=2172824 RepID=UPI001E2A547D